MLPYSGVGDQPDRWASFPFGGERDRERGAHRAQPGAVRGLLESHGLGRIGVRVRDGSHHRFDGVVVRVEVLRLIGQFSYPPPGSGESCTNHSGSFRSSTFA